MAKNRIKKLTKNPLIKGTVILTFAGLLTRFIGFFYRILLSNSLGARNLGIYQLIFPVYGICFTLYASGIQTAISKLAAEKNDSSKLTPLKTGLILSLCTSFLLSAVIYYSAPFISVHFLQTPECSEALRFLALVFPFCGTTSCINGYYYGLKKAGVPAVSQLIEQIIRVICVYILASYVTSGYMSCEFAVLGLVIGEICSCVFNMIMLSISLKSKSSKVEKKENNDIPDSFFDINVNYHSLLSLSIPLTSNRLLISILSSIESILIPIMLKQYGMSENAALSIYGILTGMSMSFILFPSTVTNSLAVMLLPAISEADSKGDKKSIQSTTSKVLHYCLLIGLFSVGLFLSFGHYMGTVTFGNETAGKYIETLAWLCPFLYISTTFGSILNGLGKAGRTFFNSIVGVLMRIVFILIFIPKSGIYGYFIGLLVSSICISVLDYLAIRKTVHIKFDVINSLIKPTIVISFLSIMMKNVYKYLAYYSNIPELFLLLGVCLITLIGYIFLLKKTNSYY